MLRSKRSVNRSAFKDFQLQLQKLNQVFFHLLQINPTLKFKYPKLWQLSVFGFLPKAGFT